MKNCAQQAAHGDAEEAFGLILDVQAGAAIAIRYAKKIS